MRKVFKIWSSAAVMLLLLQNISVGASPAVRSPSGSPRADLKLTRLSAPSPDETEPGFRFNRSVEDQNADRLQLVRADDYLPPMADDLGSCEPECCVNCWEFWEHRNAVWGEFLYLRPRGADVTYATPVDGTLATSVPVGPQAVAAFGYDAGFRVGGAWAIDRCSSFTANYMWYQADTSDSVSLPGGGSFLRADTVHPSTVNVAADSLSAQALYNFNLQSVDVNYKALLWHGDDFAVNYLFGLRYARIEQQFGATYSILGTTNVNTNVDFNGFGPRIGFEGERLLGDCGLLVYSKGSVNFLFGSNSADYLQRNIFTGIQAQTSLRETRIVTVPEFELGTGWQTCDGCFRITAGYYVSAWFNMMTTPEYLSTVRENPNSFERQVKTLTLDGLCLRAEWRF